MVPHEHRRVNARKKIINAWDGYKAPSIAVKTVTEIISTYIMAQLKLFVVGWLTNFDAIKARESTDRVSDTARVIVFSIKQRLQGRLGQSGLFYFGCNFEILT